MKALTKLDMILKTSRDDMPGGWEDIVFEAYYKTRCCVRESRRSVIRSPMRINEHIAKLEDSARQNLLNLTYGGVVEEASRILQEIKRLVPALRHEAVLPEMFRPLLTLCEVTSR